MSLYILERLCPIPGEPNLVLVNASCETSARAFAYALCSPEHAADWVSESDTRALMVEKVGPILIGRFNLKGERLIFL